MIRFNYAQAHYLTALFEGDESRTITVTPGTHDGNPALFAAVDQNLEKASLLGVNMQDETAAGSKFSDELDTKALNDASLAFIEAWRIHTHQDMTGETWNNIKSMVAAAIHEYLAVLNERNEKTPQEPSQRESHELD